jgi:hypothetical protein
MSTKVGARCSTTWSQHARQGVGDTALGPELARGERARKRENSRTAALLLLHTPPRLVPSPGALTERQHAAVEQSKICKNAVMEVHFLQKWLLPKSALKLLKGVAYAPDMRRYLRCPCGCTTLVRVRVGVPVVLATLARTRLNAQSGSVQAADMLLGRSAGSHVLLKY